MQNECGESFDLRISGHPSFIPVTAELSAYYIFGLQRLDPPQYHHSGIAKDFRFMNRVGMTISGDLFNAPNKRTTLQAETLVLNNAVANTDPTSANFNPTGVTSRPAGNRITELQSPRIWRLGAKFTF